MPDLSARTAAFDILLRIEQRDAYAAELLHSARYTSLSAADHGLATELVMGVLRWRSWLDSRLAQVSSLPISKLDSEVLTALRLAAYQLGWLDRVPARAAIFESVELVKRARKRSAASFANAVLRKLAHAPESSNPSQRIHISKTAPELSTNAAHPQWIVERWVEKFGIEATRNLCAYDQKIPATCIRLRDPEAERDLHQQGVDLEPGDFLASSRRVLTGDITHTQVFAASRVAIQDEASQLVAALVGHGARILDGCAAPGGKTWAIADHHPTSQIVAVELHPHRANLLRKRVSAENVEILTADLQQLPVGAPFDRVLVDAPCSGTGTLARNPEIKWRLRPEDLEDLHARQLAILRSALRHVAPLGRLIYSTCSLEPEENEAVIEQTLAAHPSFRLVDCRTELERLRHEGEWVALQIDTVLDGPYLRTIPGLQRCDGFFAAILEHC